MKVKYVGNTTNALLFLKDTISVTNMLLLPYGPPTYIPLPTKLNTNLKKNISKDFI